MNLDMHEGQIWKGIQITFLKLVGDELLNILTETVLKHYNKTS